MNARLAARKAKDEARNHKKAKEQILLSDKLTPAQSKEFDKNERFKEYIELYERIDVAGAEGDRI